MTSPGRQRNDNLNAGIMAWCRENGVPLPGRICYVEGESWVVSYKWKLPDGTFHKVAFKQVIDEMDNAKEMPDLTALCMPVIGLPAPAT